MDTKKRKVWFYEKTPKNTLSASNDFKNDKKVGIWWKWNEKGNLIEEKDYGTPTD